MIEYFKIKDHFLKEKMPSSVNVVKMAKNVYADQTVPSDAVWSWYTLFALAFQYALEYVQTLQT